jgi:PKD repeat protein
MFTEARPFLYRAAGGGIDRGNVAKRLPTVSEMLSDAASKASSLTNNLNTEYTTDPVQWNGWSPWAKANAYFPVKGWYSTLKALSDTPDNTVRFPFEKDTTFYHLTGTTDYPEFISVKDSLDDGREFGYVIELLESMGAYGGWVGGKIETFWTEKTGRVIFNYHDKSGSGSMIFDDIENYLVHHLWGMDENGNRFSTAFLRGPADSTGRVLSADSANGRFSIKTAFNYDPDLTTTRSGEEDPSVLTGGVSVYSVFEKLDTGLKFTHDIRSDGTDSLKYLHSTIPVYLKAAGNVTGDKPQSLLQDTEISYWNGSAWATMPEDGIDSDTLPDYVTTNALRLMRNYELGEGEQSVYIDLSTTYDVRLADTSWYSSYQGQVKGRAVHISLIDNLGTLQPIPTINTTVEYTIVLDDPTTGDTGGADPVADFSVAIDTLTASFTDLSYDTDGSITAWSWDFGDGSGTSTTQNPTYTYTTEGTYTVKLTVTDNSSRTDIDSLSITVDDSLNVAPLASFTYTKNGLEVTFDGTGSSDADGSIANYNWDFGDGNGGFGSGPTHTYSDSGSYLVRLTVTDGDGAKDSEFQTITVSSTATGGGTNNPPTADFTYTKSGLEVSFTDQSTDSDGSVIQWNWDFGDGNTSSAQNPTHTYGSDGNYTVTLTAFDDSTEIDSYSQTISVSATNQPPTASFTWSATNLSVDFTDQSADPDGFLTNWSWNFGDGSGSNQQNPSHTYGSAGTYNVTLVATDDSSDPDSYSEVVSVTTSDGSAPSAPTISSAHGADGYIVVDWHVNDETDMDYYNVYRGTSTNPTTKIAFVDYGTEWYKDNNVNNGTTYYYRVTAVDVDGNESAYSSNASDNPTAGSIAVPNGRRLHTIVEDFFPSNPYIVGTAGHDQDLSGNHGEIINREFGYVTPANDYKPSHVYPYDGATFDYSEGDNWATNARTYNQVIRVHGGLTPQNSTWAKEDVRTGAELEQYGFDYQSNLYTHLETSHSDVIGWLEPINETVESSGAWRQDKSGTDQWEAPWYKIGVDSDALSTPLYIKQALSAANTYAPSFKYVYNEFWNPTYDAVWNKIKTTVTDYLIGTHNLELDAIGWQGHFNGVGWTDNVSRMNDYRSLVDWAHNNNLGFFITEIDVIVSNAGEYDKQAKVFKDILGVLLEKRNNGFVSFNIWHPNPQANWRGISGDATPFDENYAPKPAYYAIQDTLEDVGRGQ